MIKKLVLNLLSKIYCRKRYTKGCQLYYDLISHNFAPTHLSSPNKQHPLAHSISTTDLPLGYLKTFSLFFHHFYAVCR
jgi:hypothetical protein